MFLTSVDETNLSIDEEMINVAPLSGLVRSHILKVLISDAKVLQEIISISFVKKNVCEEVIKMLTPHSPGKDDHILRRSPLVCLGFWIVYF